MDFAPIPFWNHYPNLQSIAVSHAVRAHRDSSYKILSKINTPNKGAPLEEIQTFQSLIISKLERMQTRLDFIKKVLQSLPYYRGYYRDMSATRAFQEWVDGLKCFTSTERMNEAPHNSRCLKRGNFKIDCCFHRQNEDLSLEVYFYDFIFTRDSITGRLASCEILTD